MEAVVLAGGLGNRLRAVVPDLPKPMAPVAGRPFLEWLLDYWMGQGVTRFVLSVGYMQDIIRNHFSKSYRGVPIAYASEDAPLGTGGALLQAVRELQSQQSFLLLNGDTYFEVGLDELTAFHSSRRAQWTMSLFQVEGDDRYDSVVLNGDGRIAAFGGGHGGLRNGGAYLIEPVSVARSQWMPGQACSLERELLPELLQKGAGLYGLLSNGRFLDIGVGADYAKAADIVASNRTKG